MYNVLVTGGHGQLGKCISDAIEDFGKFKKNNYTFVGHEADITDKEAIKKIILDGKYNVVVNCAAYTNVAEAETESGFEMAKKINIDGLSNLGEICKENNIWLINIGTDYIYGGELNTPIKEATKMWPFNNYGWTKFKGDMALAHLWEKDLLEKKEVKYITIVTSWLYSYYEGNFVTRMYNKLTENKTRTVVNDQVGSPTYAPDLARFILKIIEDDCFERFNKDKNLTLPNLIHFSNDGVASWYDLAKGIEEFSGLPGKVIPCRTSDFDSNVKRPSYSVLSLRKVKELFPELEIRYWRDSLKHCVDLINKEKRRLKN